MLSPIDYWQVYANLCSFVQFGVYEYGAFMVDPSLKKLCIILSMLGNEETNTEFERLPRFVVSWSNKPQAVLTPSKENNAERLTAKFSSRDWRDNSPAEHSDESQTFKT